MEGGKEGGREQEREEETREEGRWKEGRLSPHLNLQRIN